MSWKLGIGFGMFVVVAVNVAFIWVAVTGADPVEPSYLETAR